MFNPGDKVVRLSYSTHLTAGKTYTVSSPPGEVLTLTDENGIWDSDKFILESIYRSEVYQLLNKKEE